MSLDAAPAPAAPAAPPAAAPADTGGGSAPEGDSGGFDVEEARAEAQAVLAGEEPAAKAKPKPVEKPKEEVDPPNATELDENWARFRSQEKRYKEKVRTELAEIETTKSTLAAEREAFQKERSEYQARVEGGRRNPLTMLKEAGWEYPQLVAYIDSQGAVPHDKLMADFKLQVDQELEGTRTELQKIKEEKAKAERAQKISRYEGEVEREVGARIAEFPRLKRFHEQMTRKGRPQQVLHAVFKHLHENALAKNYIAPSEALRHYEQQLADADLLGTDASPGGATPGGNQPEAVKPQVDNLSPLSNGDTSERASTPVIDDDDEDSPFDVEAARAKARGLLFGR
jgi:hypothetical protein